MKAGRTKKVKNKMVETLVRQCLPNMTASGENLECKEGNRFRGFAGPTRRGQDASPRDTHLLAQIGHPECPPNTKTFSLISQSSSTMSAPTSYTPSQLLYLTSLLYRALEQSRLDSLVRIIQSVFSPHSASTLFFSVIRNARPDSFIMPASDGQNTFASWRVPLKGTFSLAGKPRNSGGC